MNTDLRKKAKNDFEKDFFRLMSNAAFGKSIQKICENIEISQTCHKRKKKELLSSRTKLSYYKFFQK